MTACAAWIAFQTRCGVAGISMWVDAELGQRIDDGVDDGGERRSGAAFAAAANAERIAVDGTSLSSVMNTGSCPPAASCSP